MYMPVFVMFMKREREMSVFKRFVMPIVSMIGSAFMVFAAAVAHGVGAAWYLLIFVVIMAIGLLFMREKKPTE